MAYFAFVMNSVLLGVGLAMDAFSVSMANGLADPQMKKKRMLLIAGTFAGFQFLMPVIGWFCVRTAAEKFEVFQKFIPWIALLLLAYIGGKMLKEGIENWNSEEEPAGTLTYKELFVQGVATSIDALSVGFTISGYAAMEAFVCSLIIAVVTLLICIGGLLIGRKFGTKLAGKSMLLGGVILIAIGLEIFIKGVFL